MGIRVIKTAIAAVIAIYIALSLNLTFPLSAGLLAILGVDVTRKRSLQSAFVRIVSSVVGLLFAIFVFDVLGFHVWAIALYICIAYPVLAKWNLKDGIISSSVIVFHVFTEETLAPSMILNELYLLLVGLGSATVVNLIYMPSWEKDIRAEKERTEEAISAVFREIAMHLRDPGREWDGRELLDAEDAIERGSELAARASENALFQGEEGWRTYFLMRDRQLEAIRRMLVLIARVYADLPYGRMTAELFDGLSRDVKSEYYAGNVEKRLAELEGTFRAMPLPATREEFETRSALLQLLFDLKHYLSIAGAMKKRRAALGLGKTK